jgi:hypothetical protein
VRGQLLVPRDQLGVLAAALRWESGLTWRAIGEQLGCSTGRACTAAHEYLAEHRPPLLRR